MVKQPQTQVEKIMQSMLQMSRLVPACAAYIKVPGSPVAVTTNVTSMSLLHDEDDDNRRVIVVLNCSLSSNPFHHDDAQVMRAFARHVQHIASLRGSEENEASGYTLAINFGLQDDDDAHHIEIECADDTELIKWVTTNLCSAARCVNDYRPCMRCAVTLLHPEEGDCSSLACAAGRCCESCVHWAAQCITRYFHRLLADPYAHACRARLRREFDDIKRDIKKGTCKTGIPMVIAAEKQ